MGMKHPEGGIGNDRLRLLKILLLVGSALAALKAIFVDYTLDEEYQVVMAYRRLTGDGLFDTMWEPHQTSAFACVWLMRLFRLITGDTVGVVLFLRVCTTVIQILLAMWLYRVCRDHTRREYAFMLGLCYFNIVPKNIQIPEFANLQVWFFTVITLSLIRYYEKGREQGGCSWKHRLWLVLAGIGMAFEVLSYPACLFLFPLFLACIFLQSGGGKAGQGKGGKKRGAADCLIFAGVCGASAVIWLGYVLRHISVDTFLRNIRYVVSFDPTHEISSLSQSRLELLVSSTATLIPPMCVIAAAGLSLWLLLGRIQKRRGGEGLPRSVLAVLFVLAAEAVQVFYWTVVKTGYEQPLIHLFVLLLTAALVWRLADGRKKVLLTGLIGSAASIAAVIYMSDLGTWYAFPHGMLGELFAALLLVYALESELGEHSKKWAYILLVGLALVSIFGKGFTLRGGRTETNSVLGIGGIIKEGPAAGIFTNYMQAYITNYTYREFGEFMEEGANCLIVTNLGTGGTSPYLFRDSNICHFSIVDPTSYDERLLTYWDLYPEKQPDVIVVECWFGELMEEEDSWIMEYIENDFHYSRCVEGTYVQFYFR